MGKAESKHIGEKVKLATAELLESHKQNESKTNEKEEIQSIDATKEMDNTRVANGVNKENEIDITSVTVHIPNEDKPDKTVNVGKIKDSKESKEKKTIHKQTVVTSDDSSSNYSSCDEEHKEQKDEKIAENSERTTEKHNGTTDCSDIESIREDVPEEEVDITQTTPDDKDKKKKLKNPFVRFQSKLFDAIANYEGFTPEAFIDFLKAAPNLKLLTALNKKLRQRELEWNKHFLDLDGYNVLLDLVDSLGIQRVTQLSDALVLLECVHCIKTLMNLKMSHEYLVNNKSSLKKLVKGKETNTMLRYSFHNSILFCPPLYKPLPWPSG